MAGERDDLHRAITAMLAIHVREWQTHVPKGVDVKNALWTHSELSAIAAATSRHLMTEIAYDPELIVLTRDDFKRHLKEAYDAGFQRDLEKRIDELAARVAAEQERQAPWRDTESEEFERSMK